ncbi:CysS/YqeB C-terminal domain-containing protein [Pseudonocardia sp.]|uniref:CysS/YqeB C-terminal domain-containing protein n=1 Tax=Pseudonocardia sp. TaxID=60912 RepID=UPI002F3F67BA
MVATKHAGWGRLVILGSGETAPTMVEMHRSVLAAAGPGTGLVLDSTYGFQENVDALTQKTVNYFSESVGRTMTPLQWRTRLDGVALDRALTEVRSARAVYAGPGSPSYTMRVWGGSGFAEAVRSMVSAGGTATFSSAAAIALGVVAMPTHEIYRGGADPFWLAGTDLLGQLTGLCAAVIPHYDLAPKNGSHDTRCCYIGERRMRELELQLPAGAHLIGVDEHTALVLDLAEGTARVVGRGGVTVRVDNNAEVLPAGTVAPLSALCPAVHAAPTAETEAPARGSADHQAPAALRTAADAAYAAFVAALADRDADAAGPIALRLEEELSNCSLGWAHPDDAEHARRTLRGMVLELAGVANDGLADPRKLLEPLIDALLEQRKAARDRRDFAAADTMRDKLAGAGIEVRDSPRGVEWSLQMS